MVSNKCKIIDIEKSVQGMSDLFDSTKKTADKCQTEIKQVHQRIDTECVGKTMLETELGQLQQQREELHDAIEDLQCRSMKNNLVFTGLKEHRNENTEEKLREFIQCELGIDKVIEFGNVHRFQKFVRGKHRPIVARFIFNNDRQAVKERGYMLRGTFFGINEQFPAGVEERRKKLYPVMKHHRSIGRHVKLVRDRLFIDGQPYMENADTEEPEVAIRPVPPTQDMSYSDAVQSEPLIDFSTPGNNNGRVPKRGRAPSTPTSQDAAQSTHGGSRAPPSARRRVINDHDARSAQGDSQRRPTFAATRSGRQTAAPGPMTGATASRPTGNAGSLRG